MNMHTFFSSTMDSCSHFMSSGFYMSLCLFNLVLELLLPVSMGRSHCIRLASFVKVLHNIFACINGFAMALQEVAVKKFLDQDFSGDALDQFKSEVSNYYYMHIFSTFISTYKTHDHILTSAD